MKLNYTKIYHFLINLCDSTCPLSVGQCAIIDVSMIFLMLLLAGAVNKIFRENE